MPELPELEVIRARLEPELTDRVIARAEARHPAVLKTLAFPLEALAGARITAVGRLGKLIAVSTDRRQQACFHLMLDGSLEVVPTRKPLTRNHLFRLVLDSDYDLRLAETGTTRRAQLHLVNDAGELARVAEAGVDPLGPDFTAARFASALARRSQTLKRFLTDQRCITGIGNAYSDEILHAARLSPFALTRGLKPAERTRLFAAVASVLRDAVRRLTALDHMPARKDRTFMQVHSRRGRPCPACGSEVRYVSYADHNTYYCPDCQTGGRVLADRRLSRLLK